MDPDTVTMSGPSVLWPPNHRLVDYALTASETAGEAGDGLPHGVTISYAATETDRGGARTSHEPDVQPPAGSAQGDFSVTVHLRLRAERAGGGDGRTYRIDWMASFDGGPHMCSSAGPGEHPFLVIVPHDRSSG